MGGQKTLRCYQCPVGSKSPCWIPNNTVLWACRKCGACFGCSSAWAKHDIEGCTPCDECNAIGAHWYVEVQKHLCADCKAKIKARKKHRGVKTVRLPGYGIVELEGVG